MMKQLPQVQFTQINQSVYKKAFDDNINLPTVADGQSSDEEGNLDDSVTAEENTIPIYKRKMLDKAQNIMSSSKR